MSDPASINPMRTMLAGVFPLDVAPQPGRRLGQLFAEGLIVTWVSVFMPLAMGLEEVGMIGMFLMAAALTDRAVYLLDENRRLIFDDLGLSTQEANQLTSISVFALFAGILTGFSSLVLVLSEAQTIDMFSFVVQAAHLDESDLFRRDFGSFGALGLHNVGVLVAIVLLSFLYRAYGAMLALGWNACVWAVVLTTLVRRAIDANPADALLIIARALVGIGPHLVLEGLAYVIASLAAIFASKAMIAHSPSGPVFWSVMRSVAAMMTAALLLLCAGAWLESWLPSAVL